VADRVLAVHPAGEQEAGRWRLSELSPDAIVASGSEFPGRDGPLSMSAGVALILGQAVSIPGLDAVQLLDAARSVLGMVEVVGEDQAPSVLVSGPLLRPAAGLDLALMGLVIDVDGIQVTTAAGAAAAGHPANSAVQGLSSQSLTLPAGSIVYAGRWTALIEVGPGSHLQAMFGHLGGITAGVL
jgi:hypothetical protein